MANIMDYLDWRGDLSFAASPFNEVDNYICCKIGGPDFTGIVPAGGETVPVAEAVRAYTERSGAAGDRLGALSSPFIVPMVRRLPDTARFGSLRLGGCVKNYDPEKVEQFAALTVGLPDGTWYISFRGTDDTIAGWKEDFLMGVMDVVPSQRDALEYLRWAARTYPGRLRVGGHSKGGNLAVYAAVHAPEDVQERILAVYNNDGPGFRNSAVGTPGYENIRRRLHVLLPQHSMVGLLLEQSEERTIVQSASAGMDAHDGFTWQVKGDAFVRSDGLSMASRAFGDAMDEMEKRMDGGERRAFVDALFEVLTSTGAVTLTDLSGHKLRQALSLGLEARRTPEVQSFLTNVLELMFREYAEEVRNVRAAPRFRWRRKPET